MTLVLLLHTAATLFMTGLIWFVQVVHYPLFAQVGQDGFTGYAGHHSRRTTWVVFPPMVIELVTGLVLLFDRPPEVSAALTWLGAGLIAIIWASTALLQVPQHRAFAGGFDRVAWQKLVLSNWVRTGAWSARAVIVLVMSARVMS